MLVRVSESTYDPIIDTLLSDVLTPNVRPKLPAVDIAEFSDRYELVSELPGLRKEDLKISVENGTLTLAGERKHYGFPEGTTVIRHETDTEPFSRSFDIPEEVHADSITAELKDGILRVQLPKSEKARMREIAVR